jgi:tetratricopeptide (TPR) repeat protein
MTRSGQSTWAVFALASLTLLGCSSISWKPFASKVDDPAVKKPPLSQGTHVKTGSDGLVLGDAEQPACTPQQFVERVDELGRAKRFKEAVRWIQRYPDVALVVLREPSAVRAERGVLETVAQAHDEQCSRCAPENTWSAIYADRSAHGDRYAGYDERRQQFMIHLQNGRLKEALQLGLSEAGQAVHGTLTAIDALRLTGIACELDGRPKDAVAAFQRGLQLTGRDHPYQTLNLLLLASDAQRRAGDLLAAERAWQDTAHLASDLVTGPHPVIDPILWERISYLRPANCPWPGEVRHTLSEVNVAFGIVADPRQSAESIASTDEAPLWTAIGHWRLARNESQAALVALKRAETLTSQPYAASRLQLSQTKALIRLGQMPAASAILIHLAGNSDPLISHPAMAMLGTAKLQQGSAQEGFNLLHNAVEEDSAAVWPEWAEAEADLGLAYLMIGDEASGLRWLHQAQQSFEAAGQQQALVQCLENEAAFLEQAKKSDLAKAVRKRVATIQVM